MPELVPSPEKEVNPFDGVQAADKEIVLCAGWRW
jgi:hypothetical protein